MNDFTVINSPQILICRGIRKDNGEYIYGCAVEIERNFFNDPLRLGIIEKPISMEVYENHAVREVEVVEIFPKTLSLISL